MRAWTNQLATLSHCLVVQIAILVFTGSAQSAEDFTSEMRQFAETGKFDMSELRGLRLVRERCDLPEHLAGRLQVKSIESDQCVSHFDSEPFTCDGVSVVQRTSIDFGGVSANTFDWPEEMGEQTVFAVSLRTNLTSRENPLERIFGGNIRAGLVDTGGGPLNLVPISESNWPYRPLQHEADSRTVTFRTGNAERAEFLTGAMLRQAEECAAAPSFTTDRILYWWSPRSIDEWTFDWTYPIGSRFLCRDPLVHGRLPDERWRKREYDGVHQILVTRPSDMDDEYLLKVELWSDTEETLGEVTLHRKALKIGCTVPEYFVWRYGGDGHRAAQFVGGDTLSCNNPRIKGDDVDRRSRHASFQSARLTGRKEIEIVKGGRNSTAITIIVDGVELRSEGTPVEFDPASVHIKCDRL